MYQIPSMFTSLLTKIIIRFLGIGKCLNTGNFLLVFENILGLCIFTNDVSESCIQEDLRERRGDWGRVQTVQLGFHPIRNGHFVRRTSATVYFFGLPAATCVGRPQNGFLRAG
uniref:Uncharacterized protein n=1 Tax=Cacopsylla melanoneura TaxID=428564 RepID=A0A8D8TSC6_9HEMI